MGGCTFWLSRSSRVFKEETKLSFFADNEDLFHFSSCVCVCVVAAPNLTWSNYWDELQAGWVTSSNRFCWTTWATSALYQCSWCPWDPEFFLEYISFPSRYQIRLGVCEHLSNVIIGDVGWASDFKQSPKKIIIKIDEAQARAHDNLEHALAGGCHHGSLLGANSCKCIMPRVVSMTRLYHHCSLIGELVF